MENNQFAEFKRRLDDSGVALVAVSKTKSASEIQRLYESGQRDFGENYVQELVDKQAHLPTDIRWHFIGHLQRNKVKYIASFVHLIQSVDSEKLIQEIDKQAAKNNRSIDILLQVHIAEEETKFGFDEAELKTVIGKLPRYQHIRVKGLMGMATFTEDPGKVKKEFSHLKIIFDRCKLNHGLNWDTLSMGMSADYQTAIESGSTMVRIGSLIFGARA